MSFTIFNFTQDMEVIVQNPIRHKPLKLSDLYAQGSRVYVVLKLASQFLESLPLYPLS